MKHGVVLWKENMDEIAGRQEVQAKINAAANHDHCWNIKNGFIHDFLSAGEIVADGN